VLNISSDMRLSPFAARWIMDQGVYDGNAPAGSNTR